MKVIVIQINAVGAYDKRWEEDMKYEQPCPTHSCHFRVLICQVYGSAVHRLIFMEDSN